MATISFVTLCDLSLVYAESVDTGLDIRFPHSAEAARTELFEESVCRRWVHRWGRRWRGHFRMMLGGRMGWGSTGCLVEIRSTSVLGVDWMRRE